MMKYLSRLLALVLGLMLILGAAPALADTCYETLKYTFSSDDNGDFGWLGQGMLVESEAVEDPEKDAVFFYVSFDRGYASVVGRNAEGQPETCMWMEAEPADLLMAAVQVAASYETLNGYVDQCTQLVLVISTDAEAEPVYITDAENAQAFIDLILSAMEGAAGQDAAQ